MHSSSPAARSTPVSPAEKWTHTKIRFAGRAGQGTIDEEERDTKIKPLLNALKDSDPTRYLRSPIVSDIFFGADRESKTNPDLPWRYLSLLETRLENKNFSPDECTDEIISAACYLIADTLAKANTQYPNDKAGFIKGQYTNYPRLLREYLNNTSIEDAKLEALRQFFKETFPALNTLLERNSPLTTLGEYAAVFLYAAIVTDPAVLVAEAEQLRQPPERLATLRTLVTARLSNNFSELHSAFAEAEKKGASPTLKQLKQQIFPPQAATSLEQASAAAAAAAAAAPPPSSTANVAATVLGKRPKPPAPSETHTNPEEQRATKTRKTGLKQAATGEPVSSGQQVASFETSTTAPRPDTPRPRHC